MRMKIEWVRSNRWEFFRNNFVGNNDFIKDRIIEYFK